MLYLFLARLLGSLLAAYLLVRRLRAPLRSLIVRAMPLKVRMSEKAFALQARISNIAGLTIWLLFAALLFWGSSYLQSFWGSPDNENMEILPSPPPQPVYEKTPEAAPEAKVSAPDVAATPAQQNEPRLETPPPQPTPYSALISEPYYLQLGAYQYPQHARRSQSHYATHVQRPGSQRVWVAHAAGTAIPYKVLVGPFPSRRAAVQFRKNHGLRGFPRPLEEMMLYQQ